MEWQPSPVRPLEHRHRRTRSRGGGDLPTVGLPAELAALSADLGITPAGLSSAAEPPIDASEAQVAAVALKAAAVVVLEESDS